MPFAEAVIVAVCAVVTALTVALNPVLIAPDLTVAGLGTLTAGLLLVSLTTVLLLSAAVR